MSLKDVKYDAFISYRHTDPDGYVAKTLHKKLETFKIPRSVVKKHNLKSRRISRVFRDEEELPLEGSLNDSINMALQNAGKLIVICSPRLQESVWCQKEIDTFISLHGRDNVVLVLVEGEPEQSFPRQLTFDGEKVIEPLAADVRGKNKRQMKKQMDEAVVKIIAAILGLNYDDLRQRHRERKIRQTMAFFGTLTVVLTLFLAFTLSMLLKLKAQSETIETQLDTIVSQSDLLRESYRENKAKFAQNQAENARKLITEGRFKDALYVLRSVSPDDKSDAETPYVSDVEYAITDVMSLYSDSNKYVPDDIFEAEGIIRDMFISDDGNIIVLSDVACNLYVYDMKSGESRGHINDMSAASDEVCIFYNRYVCYVSFSGTTNYYDIETGKKDVLGESCSLLKSMGNTLCIGSSGVFGGTVSFYDKDLNLISTCDDCGGSFMNYSDAQISMDNNYAFVFGDDDKDTLVWKINIQTGEVEDSINEKLGSISKTAVNGKYVYLVTNDFGDTFDLENIKHHFVSVSMEDLSIRDYPNFDGNFLDYMEVMHSKDGSNIIAFMNNSVYSYIDYFNLDTGEYVNRFSLPVKFAGVLSNDGNTLRVMAENGELHTTGTNMNDDYISSIMGFELEKRIKKAFMAHGKIYVYFENSDYLCSYSLPENEYTLLATGNVDGISRDGRYYVLNNDEDFTSTVYETETGKEIFTIASWNYKIIYDENNQRDLLAYEEGGSITVCDMSDGSVVGGVENPDYKSFKQFTSDGLVSIFSSVDHDTNLRSFELYDTLSGNKLFEIKMENRTITQNEMFKADVNGTYNIIAYTDQNEGCIVMADLKGQNKHTVDVSPDAVVSLCVSSDGKHVLVGLTNNSVMIVNSKTGEMEKTFFDFEPEIKGFVYCEAQDRYLLYVGGILDLGGIYVSDGDFNLISFLESAYDYNSDKKEFYIVDIGSDTIYSKKLLEYDEIIDKLDEALGTYKPSDKIIDQYNL